MPRRLLAALVLPAVSTVACSADPSMLGAAPDPATKPAPPALAGDAGAGDAAASPGSARPTTTVTLTQIEDLAVASTCASRSWNDRGRMPKAFLRGVTLTFARAVCQPTRTDIAVVAQANTGSDDHDVLSWYDSNFQGAGMTNDAPGMDTLRHVYTMLLSLGMQESSGEHCCGRDTSATNTSADSAEAGAWQTSYDSHTLNPELPKLFAKYQASSAGCYLDVFRQDVTCSASNWENWGDGDGEQFQALEKDCPAFAAEYAAVMLRVAGGRKGHYGPLRTKAAELAPECDEMLAKVQALVTGDASACAALF